MRTWSIRCSDVWGHGVSGVVMYEDMEYQV